MAAAKPLAAMVGSSYLHVREVRHDKIPDQQRVQLVFVAEMRTHLTSPISYSFRRGMGDGSTLKVLLVAMLGWHASPRGMPNKQSADALEHYFSL